MDITTFLNNYKDDRMVIHKSSNISYFEQKHIQLEQRKLKFCEEKIKNDMEYFSLCSNSGYERAEDMQLEIRYLIDHFSKIKYYKAFVSFESTFNFIHNAWLYSNKFDFWVSLKNIDWDYDVVDFFSDKEITVTTTGDQSVPYRLTYFCTNHGCQLTIHFVYFENDYDFDSYEYDEDSCFEDDHCNYSDSEKSYYAVFVSSRDTSKVK